jgi:hypothetical protein
MKILNTQDFVMEAGIPMPKNLLRDMSAYNGSPFVCACGKEHNFESSYMDFRNFATNGSNAKMIVTCPDDSSIATLIKTKYKLLVIFKGFESLAGNKG